MTNDAIFKQRYRRFTSISFPAVALAASLIACNGTGKAKTKDDAALLNKDARTSAGDANTTDANTTLDDSGHALNDAADASSGSDAEICNTACVNPTPALAPVAAGFERWIVISRVRIDADGDNDQIELTNLHVNDIDITTGANGDRLCSDLECVAFPDTNAGSAFTSFTIPANRTVTLHLARDGTNNATNVYLGAEALDLGAAKAIALYNTPETGTQNRIVSLVQWAFEGTLGPTITQHAVAEQLWESADAIAPLCGQNTRLVATGDVSKVASYVSMPDDCL